MRGEQQVEAALKSYEDVDSWKTVIFLYNAALKEVGIPYAHGKFIPHITLIRKSASKKPYQVNLRKAEMSVERVSLMKSERKNGKMVYREI